jgi:cell division protein FtsW (lipid II flippase)
VPSTTRAEKWWSRLGAFLAIYSVAALTLGSAAVYAPWLADFVMKGTWVKWLSGSVTLGGITAVWSGLAAARSPDTGGEGGNSNKEMLAKLAPFVFIAGLLIWVSADFGQLLAATMDCRCQSVWQTLDWSITGSQLSVLAIAAAISAATLLLLAWRVDMNEASMNPFYRNRLVRCYLGAARAALGRRSQPVYRL